MKRFFSVLLVFTISFILTACGNPTPSAPSEDDTANEIEIMSQDAKTTNDLIQEALDNYKAGSSDLKYNNNPIESATLEDILKEGGAEYRADWFCRVIRDTKYSMIWVAEGKPNGVVLSALDNNDDIGLTLDGDFLLSDLAK